MGPETYAYAYDTRVYTAIYAFNSEEIRVGWQHRLSKANIVLLKYSKFRV